MDTYTIAAAARLVGAPKAKLYQAIRAGRLQAASPQAPGQALTVIAAALQAAGFAVPASALPHRLRRRTPRRPLRLHLPPLQRKHPPRLQRAPRHRNPWPWHPPAPRQSRPSSPTWSVP